MKTSTKTLATALRVLAVEIKSEDGIANAAIAEAAERLEQLENALRTAKHEVCEAKSYERGDI